MNIDALTFTPDERLELLSRRQALLDRMFRGVMTRIEKIELTRIRWALDRIEAAEMKQPN